MSCGAEPCEFVGLEYFINGPSEIRPLSAAQAERYAGSYLHMN
jgi:hypothetical protein